MNNDLLHMGTKAAPTRALAIIAKKRPQNRWIPAATIVALAAITAVASPFGIWMEFNCYLTKVATMLGIHQRQETLNCFAFNFLTLHSGTISSKQLDITNFFFVFFSSYMLI
jgi:hypothetical protein